MKNPRLKWGVVDTGAPVSTPKHKSGIQKSFYIITRWTKGECKGISFGSILKNAMLLSCSCYYLFLVCIFPSSYMVTKNLGSVIKLD